MRIGDIHIENDNSLDEQIICDEKTAKQEALNSKSPKLLPPANSRENISVSFNGGINVQTTDGKIPNNSQLSADVQREVEMAIKRAKENEKNRSLSDVI